MAIERSQTRTARVPQAELAQFLSGYADMLNSGMPTEVALSSMRGPAMGARRRRLVQALSQPEMSGAVFSERCAAYPAVFPPLYVAMFRAGEVRGRLPDSLKAVSSLILTRLALRRRMILALIYPVVVLVLATILATSLVTFALPNLVESYTELKQPLPKVTSSLIRTVAFVRSYSAVALATVAALIVGLGIFRRTIRGKVTTDWLRSRLPVLKSLTRKTVTARFARAYGSLLEGGIDITQAIRLSASATHHCLAEQVLINASRGVARGAPLSTTLQDEGFLDPRLLEILATGEKTGRADTMLAQLADALDAEVANIMTALMIALPILGIVLLGLLVGWLALAIMIPWVELPGLIQ